MAKELKENFYMELPNKRFTETIKCLFHVIKKVVILPFYKLETSKQLVNHLKIN